MKIPLPEDLCSSISAKAAQYARENVQNLGWGNKSIQGSPTADGQVGIKVSDKYLIHQSRGFKPFLMTWVEGRNVPLHDKETSATYIRRGSGVGQPGYVTLPGGVKKWRDQRWRHPGLKPKKFLENAISRAIREAKPQIQQELRKALKGDG